jgi:hypothetical protein
MMSRLALSLALCSLPALTAAPASAALRSQAGAYEVQVLVGGAPVQTYHHGGESYVLGHHGSRYTLRVYNHSSQRIEAVVSVDGRDVVDGRAADYRTKRGYLVPAYGSVDIDGWRISRGEAAAFRFSTVASSYAARTGSAREVGVIGVAVFPERYVPPPRPVYIPRPYTRDDDYRGYPKDKAARGDESAPPPPPAPESAQKSAPSSTPAHPGGGYGALEDRRESEQARSRSRAGLGTEFGERVDSAVQEVSFLRNSPSYPAAVLGVRYNDRQGLYALGIDVDGDGGGADHDAYLRRTAQPFPVVERRYASPPPGWDYR